MRDILKHLFILFTTLLFGRLVFGLVEGAASAPGTLVQLATSRPYEYGGAWVRPVRQRGVFFGRPDLPGAWHR